VVLYVDLASFKSDLSIPDSSTDSTCTMALEAASRVVEVKTNRKRYWLGSVDETRNYEGVGYAVFVDDITSITSVTVASSRTDTFTTYTDYDPYPLNAPADGRPYTRLILDRPYRYVKLTGRYGWPEVPGQIKEAVTIIASRVMKRVREAPFGIVTSGGIEGTVARIVREDPDVAEMLKSITRFAVSGM
jgi:hypothetical protein